MSCAPVCLLVRLHVGMGVWVCMSAQVEARPELCGLLMQVLNKHQIFLPCALLQAVCSCVCVRACVRRTRRGRSCGGDMRRCSTSSRACCATRAWKWLCPPTPQGLPCMPAAAWAVQLVQARLVEQG